MPTRSRSDQLHSLLRTASIIPVVTIDHAEQGVPLARALVAGGLNLIEITLRTPAALDAARAIIQEVPEAIVGIGTALKPDDLKQAESLGAQFVLSPGAEPELLAAAASSRVPFIPGIATASELMAALKFGFDTVKFFPAGAAGGIPALKALSGPFPHVRFCPTGGIDSTNAKEWLSLSNVLAVGGSWICPPADMTNKAWDRITARAREALAAVSS